MLRWLINNFVFSPLMIRCLFGRSSFFAPVDRLNKKNDHFFSTKLYLFTNTLQLIVNSYLIMSCFLLFI